MLVISRLTLLFGVCLACVAGCGEKGDRVEVEGVVTLNGQPMPGVHVLFDQPELPPNANTGYVGTTDEQGRYVLGPIGQDDTGARPGKYRVSLTTAVADPSQPAPTPPRNKPRTGFYSDEPPPPPERIPPAYRGGKLSFEVPEGGTDEANFALKSR